MKIKKLENMLEKLFGVAFRDKIEPVYFQTRWGIHTFFVKKPIDVFILDESFRVRIIKRGLNPGKLFFWNPTWLNVVETSVNYGSFKKIKVGDIIKQKIFSL